MEILAYAMSIVAAYLFLRLFQETITRKNAVDDLKRANQTIADITADLSTASYQLEKVAKERDELRDELGKCYDEYDQFIVKHHGMVGKLKSILTDAISKIP